MIYSPFSDTGILYRNMRVDKISEEPLWLISVFWKQAFCKNRIREDPNFWHAGFDQVVDQLFNF